MFPMMFPLLGAAAGALFNKDDPLKGALMGGALGAAGGALPGLLGAGGATAGVAPGATAATEAAGGVGLLGAETGLNAAGYLAPEMTGTIAEQAAAPVIDMSSKAGMFDTLNFQSGGLLGKGVDAFNTANKIAQPVGKAMDVAQQMRGDDIPPPPPPQLPAQKMDLSGLLQFGQQQQAYDAQEAERRKQLMRLYSGNIGNMGGY